MGKLYFHYSTMNAGKSTMLLQAAHNYMERGMVVYLLTAQLDCRAGEGKIASRIGVSMDANTFREGDDLFCRLAQHLADHPSEPFACVFIDEAQFLTKEQVWQLAQFVDEYNLPVMCYGLRLDFQSELFPGSAALLALADELREVRTICHCGRKATMVVRRDESGKAQREGAQVQIGGNDVYVSLCRRHWMAEMGRTPPALPPLKKPAPSKVAAMVDVEGAASNDTPTSPFGMPHEVGAMTAGGEDACGSKGIESPK